MKIGNKGIYHAETEPIITEMERVGVCVVRVDATPPIEEVTEAMIAMIGKTCGIHPVN